MKTIFAFVFGVSVGAVLALLFAPKSGSELRRQLGDEAAADRMRMQERYTHAVQGTQDRVDKLHADVQTLMNNQLDREAEEAAEAVEEDIVVEESVVVEEESEQPEA
jgi:gas vesicle protein